MRYSALDGVTTLLESIGGSLLTEGLTLFHLYGGTLLAEVDIDIGDARHAGEDRTDPLGAAIAS